MAEIPVCRTWRCWIQDNFTAVALLCVVLFSIALVVTLMHEDKIDDKYVTWLEGFASGAFSTWTLALKSSGVDKKQDEGHVGPTTNINVPPPVPLASPEPKETPTT